MSKPQLEDHLRQRMNPRVSYFHKKISVTIL